MEADGQVDVLELEILWEIWYKQLNAAAFDLGPSSYAKSQANGTAMSLKFFNTG